MGCLVSGYGLVLSLYYGLIAALIRRLQDSRGRIGAETCRIAELGEKISWVFE